jgi:hypothetical protein
MGRYKESRELGLRIDHFLERKMSEHPEVRALAERVKGIY